MALPVAAVGVEYIRELSQEDLETVQDIIEHARRYMGVMVPENIVVALCAKRKGLPYRPITAWEETTLLAGAKGLANDCLQDVLILALDTALVQQEILDLKVNQVDLDSGIIRMSPTRIIPLSTRAKTILTRRNADNHGTIFHNLPKNTVQTAFIRLKNKLGFNGPDFNDIRKIAIVRLAEKMNIHELKDLLGYQRYTALEWLMALQRG
jgi:integrase